MYTTHYIVHHIISAWCHGTRLLWVKSELKNIVFKHADTHTWCHSAGCHFLSSVLIFSWFVYHLFNHLWSYAVHKNRGSDWDLLHEVQQVQTKWQNMHILEALDWLLVMIKCSEMWMNCNFTQGQAGQNLRNWTERTCKERNSRRGMQGFSQCFSNRLASPYTSTDAYNTSTRTAVQLSRSSHLDLEGLSNGCGARLPNIDPLYI